MANYLRNINGCDVYAGPWCEKLYKKLRGIQTGTEPDEFGWNTLVEI